MQPSGEPWPLQELLTTSPSVVALLISAGVIWQKFRQLQQDVSMCSEAIKEHDTWIARAEGRLESERNGHE